MTACPDEFALEQAMTDDDPQITAHVATCTTCRATWDDTQRAIALVRQRAIAEPSIDQREQLRTALLAAAQAAPLTRPRRRMTWLVGGALAAAAAVTAVLLARETAPVAHAHARVQPLAGAVFTSVTTSPDEIVLLHDGAIAIDVAPLHAGERFRVVLADAEIEVHGTAFVATARAGRLVGVTVQHGIVEVRAHAAPAQRLLAGDAWTAPTLAAVHPPRDGSATSASATSAASTGASSTGASSTGASSTGASSTGTSSTGASSTGASSTGASSTGASSTGASSTGASSTGTSKTAAVANGSSTNGSARNGSPTNGSATNGSPTNGSATNGSPTNGSASSSARGAARKDFEVAYDDAWNAMRGGLYLRAADSFARAQLLDPDGPLAEDATLWRAIALERAGESTRAAVAFRTFLATYPRAARAGEASAMLGWILVTAGQRTEAEQRFRAALADPTPAVRASARAGLEALHK